MHAPVAGSDVALSDLSAPWLAARGVHESRQRPVGQSDAVEAPPVGIRAWGIARGRERSVDLRWAQPPVDS